MGKNIVGEKWLCMPWLTFPWSKATLNIDQVSCLKRSLLCWDLMECLPFNNSVQGEHESFLSGLYTATSQVLNPLKIHPNSLEIHTDTHILKCNWNPKVYSIITQWKINTVLVLNNTLLRKWYVPYCSNEVRDQINIPMKGLER